MIEIDKETIERIKMLVSKIKEKLVELEPTSGNEDGEYLSFSFGDEEGYSRIPEMLRFSGYEDRYRNITSYGIALVLLYRDDEGMPSIRYKINEIFCASSGEDDEGYGSGLLSIDEILDDYNLTKYVDFFELEYVLLNILNIVSNDGYYEDDWEYSEVCSKK